MKTLENTDIGVIFDVDGTMVDNAAWHREAWVELGRRHCIPITETYYQEKIHSRNNPDIVARLQQEFPDAGITDDIDLEKEVIYRELYRPRIVITPGLMDFLTALSKAGVPMAAASNSPLANVEMIFEELDIGTCFQAIFTPDMGIEGKPSPAMYQRAADALGLPLEQCMIFEDSVSGFRACESVGARYMVILFGAEEGCLAHAENAVAHHADFTTVTIESIRAGLKIEPES